MIWREIVQEAIRMQGSAVCAGPRGIPVTSRKLYAVVDLLLPQHLEGVATL